MIKNPNAAKGVSCGLILSRDGSMSPSDPSSSEIPINLTKAGEYSFTQGSDSANFSMGVNDFIIPAMRNIAANNP
jgi:hypothetical protein